MRALAGNQTNPKCGNALFSSSSLKNNKLSIYNLYTSYSYDTGGVVYCQFNWLLMVLIDILCAEEIGHLYIVYGFAHCSSWIHYLFLLRDGWSTPKGLGVLVLDKEILTRECWFCCLICVCSFMVFTWFKLILISMLQVLLTIELMIIDSVS